MKYRTFLTPNFKDVKDNEIRDSLFMSLVEGYYGFIRERKQHTGLNYNELHKQYPLQIVFEPYYIPTTPQLFSGRPKVIEE